MKNKVTPPKSGGISRAAVARHYDVNGGSVTAWVKAGCPQLPNGLFVLAEVDKWLQARQEKKAERASLKDQKTQAEIDRIQRDIAKRDLELSRDRGEVHSKSDCAAGLVQLAGLVSSRCNSRPQRFRTAFPEASQSMIDWLERDNEEDATYMQSLHKK